MNECEPADTTANILNLSNSQGNASGALLYRVEASDPGRDPQPITIILPHGCDSYL
jgi:hypothetical protein